MSQEWKKKPLDEALKGMKALPHLKEAGFKTVGDVVDASAEEIADRTLFIGIKRARNLRDVALLDALNDLMDTQNDKAFKSEPKLAPILYVNESPETEIPMHFQIIVFIAFGLSVISFVGLVAGVLQ